MPPPSFTVAMLGARMNYAVPRALHCAGQLNALVTDFYLPDGPTRVGLKALATLPGTPAGLHALLGRHHPDLVGAHIRTQSVFGLRQILRRRSADNAQDKLERVRVKGSGARLMAEILANDLPDLGAAVYAFQEAALETFEVARTRDVACVLEQSIAARPYAFQLLQKEIADWNHWFDEGGVPQTTPERTARLRAEWGAANRIVAASEFVRTSLLESGVPSEKITVMPYGVTLPERQLRAPNYDGSRALRVLFGGHLHLRKGVQHLLRAVESLGPSAVELRMVGGIGLTREIIDRFAPLVDFRGRVPRSEMSAHFNWADVFVLPSLIEGSATVVYEALSCGLPAVVTPNAGSVVEDGVDGQVVAASSAEAIARALSVYLDDPQALHAQAEGARAAAHKVSYDRYEADLRRFFRTFGREG